MDANSDVSTGIKRFKVLTAAVASALCACAVNGGAFAEDTVKHLSDPTLYEYEATRELVALVNDAAELVQKKGEAAFEELRVPDSRWRQDEMYIIVLNPAGKTLVHPDPALEGHETLDLEDIHGRSVIRGIIDAATGTPGETAGWYHYEWPVPGQLLPRWKSTYVRLVETPSGEPLIVASGIYNDRMEKPFVVDMVASAVHEIEAQGEKAFEEFHDKRGPYRVKDAYIFVFDPSGVDLVNPAFPNLEGRNLFGLKDTQGKELIREMFQVVESQGEGWVEYMWPKPGDSVSTQKSAYVTKASLGDDWVLVGSGVYLADAPQVAPDPNKLSAPQLTSLVREAASVFERQGEDAYPEFRDKSSKWFRDDTYFFVWTMDGRRVFHAADPSIEGQDASGAKDSLGRPYGKMLLDVAAGTPGEGWVHYIYPEPGSLFPVWKSTFVKRVRFPSGKDHLIGAGIYNLKMDEAFITDLVDRAAALVAEEGEGAFPELRDQTGPFVFMDTYVFVTAPDGTGLVNPGHPSMEGVNIIDLRDAEGNLIAGRYIPAALEHGSAWVDYQWYKPGDNTVSLKRTYVRSVQADGETLVVGSGYYPES